MHASGVVHGDLHEANIVFDAPGITEWHSKNYTVRTARSISSSVSMSGDGGSCVSGGNGPNHQDYFSEASFVQPGEAIDIVLHTAINTAAPEAVFGDPVTSAVDVLAVGWQTIQSGVPCGAITK